MSKVLRTAAFVVGAVALTVATAGLAAPGVVTAFTAATGLTAATVGTISSGLALAATLTAKKPGQSAVGSPEQFAADPNAFIPYAIGRTATAGNIVRRRAWDTGDKGDNDRQAFVVALSGGGPIDGIESFKADNSVVTFNASTGAALGGEFAGFMWQRTQFGACPEPSALSFGAGGTPPGWTSQHRLSGFAAATWTLRFDTKAKVYNNGPPQPQWVLRGVKVYDPRKDSTYPGGSGSCRALNEATYVYSECPYLHGLTWCLGRWQNGKRVLGLGAPIAGIDVAAFVEGANIADAAGWKVGGVVYSGDPKWDVLKRILQAGMGEPLALGAKISCFVNAPKVSLDTITDADLAGGASVAATQPRRTRINSVIPRYRSEAHDWKFVAGAPIRVATHVTEDGGERTKETPYPLIQSIAQVAVAARYDIENAREFGPITLPLRTRWIGYKPGDCLTANITQLGLVDQQIMLLNRGLDPASLCPTLTARSETAAKHAFALGQTGTAPPTPSVSGPPIVPVPEADAWAIIATSITADGVTTPALVIDGLVDSSTAQAVLFEYREFLIGQGDDAGWIAAGIEPPTTTRKVIASVAVATGYEVSVRYQRNGQLGARLVLGPVGTDGFVLPAAYLRYADGRTGQELQPAAPGAHPGAPGNAPIGGVLNSDGSVTGGVPAFEFVSRLSSAQQILADAANAVGGPIPERLRLTNITVAQAMAAALSNQLVIQAEKARVDELTHIDGERIKIVVRREETQRIEGDAISYAALDLVLLKSGGSYTSLLRTDTLEVEPGKTLVAVFSEIAAATDGVSSDLSAAITMLTTVITDGDAATASAAASALAAYQASVDGQFANVDAQFLVEASVRSTAIAAATSALEAQLSTVETDVADVAAGLLLERSTSANELAASTAAIEDQLSEIATDVADVAAGLVTERSTSASELAAATASIEAQLSSVETDVADVAAGLVTERTTSASELAASTAAIEAQLSTVATDIADVAAGLISERNTSASEDAAQTEAREALAASVTTQFGTLSSTVETNKIAAADANEATASLVTGVTARLNDVGGVSVEDRIEASASDIDGLKGEWTVAIGIGGRLQGIKLAGSANAPAQLGLIDTDLAMGDGRVIFDNGTYMRVQGVGFGAAGDLIDWYGPSMPIAQCTTANGSFYLTTTGRARLDELIVGSLRNATATSSLATDASITLGPFNSEGGPKSVALSYVATGEFNGDAGGLHIPPGVSDGSATSASIELYRRVGGGSWTLIHTLEAAGTWDVYPPSGFEYDYGYGRATIVGSVTLSDPTASTDDFEYRADLVARSIAGTNILMQRISIISTEE